MKSIAEEFAPRDSSFGSGGSPNNPMYNNIACEGYYSPMSGRGKKRHIRKSRGLSISKKRKFYDLKMTA